MGNCSSSITEPAMDPRSGQKKTPPQVVDIISHGDFYIQIVTNKGKASMTGCYFQVADGSEYSILLGNAGSNHANCDAELYLDGEYAGLYRIDAGTELVIERPT
jgi:hypothetical protein